jgi:hypothetical protein
MSNKMTTASATDVMTSLNNLNNGGISNDGVISTDGSGNINTPKGQLRNVSIITPFTLMTNPTINAGNTASYTGSGGSTGVPTSATAIFVGYSFTCGTVGAYANIGPLGATLSQYITTPFISVSNQYVSGFAIIPLSSNQFSVKANTGNIVLNSWTVWGYIN